MLLLNLYFIKTNYKIEPEPIYRNWGLVRNASIFKLRI